MDGGVPGTRKCDQAEVVATYKNWHELLQQLINANKTWYKWALYDREPLEQWHVGRATLLGDSAHATLPYLGQGAAMAIEDGYVLALCLSTSEDPDEALRLYEQLRKTRTRRVVLASRARAKENHLASPWNRFKRDVRIAIRTVLPGTRPCFRASGSINTTWRPKVARSPPLLIQVRRTRTAMVKLADPQLTAELAARQHGARTHPCEIFFCNHLVAYRWAREYVRLVSKSDRSPIRLSPSKRPELVRGELSVSHRVADVPVTQVRLERPGIGPLIGKGVAARVAQHMRVSLDPKINRLGSPLDQSPEP